MELININKANYDYGIDCARCHDANETPEFVYVSFTNIKRGALWAPGDPDPPNQIFKLPLVFNCWWGLAVGPLNLHYITGVGQTNLWITYPPNPNVFTDGPFVECVFNFTNDQIVPAGNKYYDGEALVTWVEPPKLNSLAYLCELLNIPTDGLTDCLVYPVGGTQQVVNMLRGTHQTKILIKQDFA